jgi:hypothetical protein
LKRFLCRIALLVLAATFASHAQTLTNLTHQAPDSAQLQFLLTDGTVLVQGFQGQDWWKLTPDNTGSYLHGTWTQMASLASNYDPSAFASQVLADGRVLIEGGEYNFGQFSFTNLGAVYDPTTNIWTPLTPPPGFDYIGDSPSAVLPNTHFLIGRKFDMQIADLDPSTMTWTSLGSPSGKADWNAEEGWTPMPNGTIQTADVLASPNSEHYIPTEQRWLSDGPTPVNLMGPPEVGCINYGGGQYCPPGEIGPAILRPDGSVFATGALHVGATAGHTAIYRSGATPYVPGTWTTGPDFPNHDYSDDTFAVLLTNGKVLAEGASGRLYEFDGTNFVQTLNARGSALIVLPTGEVLVGGEQIYTAAGGPLQIWAPIVTICPSMVTRGQTYRVIGRQFNGLSTAAGFGDEYETNTNYPLVRIKNNATGHIFYARTHNHSTMAVATKAVPTFTNFDVPANMETGASTLFVVANGIASNPISITVQ